MEITFRARSYLVQKIEQETEEGLAERAWFIINLLNAAGDNSSKDKARDRSVLSIASNYDEAELLSRYWFYVKRYDCKYSPEIMAKLALASKITHV